MSCELINRISIKKDGVYVSTHSNNDTAPCHSVKINSLTEAYRKGGQSELDKEVINMFFYNADFRGNHKSILPYKSAIDQAIHNKDFIEIRNKYDEMDNKAFNIANRFDEYKNLSKEEAHKKYLEVKPIVEELKNQRNEFVAELVESERTKINGPKELKDGIYEIIPVHRIEEKIGEVYSEYMNFNSNNGTIIYEKRMGHLLPNPETIKISEYQNMINKRGIDNIVGANEFEKFIHKYPEIYIKGINNEEKIEEINEEENENQM